MLRHAYDMPDVFWLIRLHAVCHDDIAYASDAITAIATNADMLKFADASFFYC